jgi:hypothetical protein
MPVELTASVVWWSDLLAANPEVLGLEQGPSSLVRINEELLDRESSGSGLENRD